MEECPKCHCPIIDGETVITAFSIGREHVYLCYECGKEFEELKEKIDNRHVAILLNAYYTFIDEPTKEALKACLLEGFKSTRITELVLKKHKPLEQGKTFTFKLDEDEQDKDIIK